MQVEEKIAKLLRLAGKNPSPEEAAIAFARAQEIALRHGLALDEIDTDEDGEQEIPEIEDIGIEWLVRWGKRIAWQVQIVRAVCRANGLRWYFKNGYRSRRGPHERGGVKIVGQPRDAHAAQLMFNRITHEIDRLARDAVKVYKRQLADGEIEPDVWDGYDYREATPREYGRAWRMGCADAVAERVRDRVDYVAAERHHVDAKRANAIHGNAEDPNALEKATEALVRVERASDYVREVERIVEEYYERISRNFVTSAPLSGASTAAGYTAGRRAGSKINTGKQGAIK